MGAACDAVVRQMQQFQALPKSLHRLEAFILTPDLIKTLHQILMKGILHNAGQYRTARAYDTTEDGDFPFFQEPEVIETTLQTVCDRYNAHLERVAQQPDSLFSRDIVLLLVKLAATLFAEFIAVHPFSNGNGRLGRILMSHVLHAVTPFLVTPTVAPDHKAARKMYLDCIAETDRFSQYTFVHLSHACSLSALLLHALWKCWRCCFQNLARYVNLPLTASPVKRWTVCQRAFILLPYILGSTLSNNNPLKDSWSASQTLSQDDHYGLFPSQELCTNWESVFLCRLDLMEPISINESSAMPHLSSYQVWTNCIISLVHLAHLLTSVSNASPAVLNWRTCTFNAFFRLLTSVFLLVAAWKFLCLSRQPKCPELPWQWQKFVIVAKMQTWHEPCKFWILPSNWLLKPEPGSGLRDYFACRRTAARVMHPWTMSCHAPAASHVQKVRPPPTL